MTWEVLYELRNVARMDPSAPCARCGRRATASGEILCDPCIEVGPLTPDEAESWNLRLLESREEEEDR